MMQWIVDVSEHAMMVLNNDANQFLLTPGLERFMVHVKTRKQPNSIKTLERKKNKLFVLIETYRSKCYDRNQTAKNP